MTVYAVQVLHLVGSGLLSNVITSVVGGRNKATWVINPISIAAGTLGPPVSQAADYWGRKWFVAIPTICGFVGCLILSRADTFGVLIIGQSIAALATAAQPLLHAIASEITPRKYRSLAQAAVNAGAALGAIIGLLMGGALVRTNPNGFRVYFYISSGLYAVGAAVIILLYHPPLRELQQLLTTSQKLARLDWIGYAFFFPGLILFCFALTSSSGVYPWKSATIVGPLVVGAVLLIAFGLYEWKGTRTGMLHHDLFSRGRNFALAEAIQLVEGLVFFAATQYYGFEVSVLYDKDLFQAGLDYTVGWWTVSYPRSLHLGTQIFVVLSFFRIRNLRLTITDDRRNHVMRVLLHMDSHNKTSFDDRVRRLRNLQRIHGFINTSYALERCWIHALLRYRTRHRTQHPRHHSPAIDAARADLPRDRPYDWHTKRRRNHRPGHLLRNLQRYSQRPDTCEGCQGCGPYWLRYQLSRLAHRRPVRR